MKNTITTIFCLISFISFSQNKTDSLKKIISSNNITITDIINYGNLVENNSSQIYFNLTMLEGITKTIEYDKMTDILNVNVVQYYELGKTYDSESKINAYKKTEDFKNYLKELETLRNFVISSYFYFTIDLGCNNKYDLKSKTFIFSTEVLKDYFYNPNYLQFENFCILKPNCFKYKEFDQLIGKDKVYNQDIYVPIPNETTAHNIENNCQDVKLMFIFKLSDVITRNVSYNGSTFGTSNIRTKQIIKAIIYSNNQIYKQYTPVLTPKK